jgi:ribosome-binding factor A
MPRLHFIHDTTGDRGQRLAALIEHALASDERARRAEQT